MNVYVAVFCEYGTYLIFSDNGKNYLKEAVKLVIILLLKYLCLLYVKSLLRSFMQHSSFHWKMLFSERKRRKLTEFLIRKKICLYHAFSKLTAIRNNYNKLI